MPDNMLSGALIEIARFARPGPIPAISTLRSDRFSVHRGPSDVSSFSSYSSFATDKHRPHALRVPNLFHIGTHLGLVLTKHIATITLEKGRNSVIRNAMDMHRDFF
jgi:hypothetical protein